MAGLDLSQVERRARELSEEFNHFYIGTEHAFLAVLLDEPYLREVLAGYDITPKIMTEAILKIAERGDGSPPWKGFWESPRWGEVKRRAEREARDAGSRSVQSQHVVAAILREGRGIPARVLSELDVNLPQLRGEVLLAGSGDVEAIPPGKGYQKGAARDMEGMAGMADMADIVEGSPRSPGRRRTDPDKAARGDDGKKRKGKSALLDYGRNLTELAREGQLEPVIGRQDEIRRCLQILTRKSKNNPVLIGEAGVGKSSVAYGLAHRIAEGRVPEIMREKELWELSMTRIVAGAAYKGEFQERMTKLMDEVHERPNVILFIDEIHMMMGAGDHKGGMDAGNILKPALARGEFPVIGATTTDEFQKTIETDPALERRFQPVLVNEPSEAECLEILEGLRPRYEQHHGIKIVDKALIAAVKLSTRFLPDRSLPDKAIDLIDEAAARVKLSASSKSIIMEGPPRFEVREEDIAEVVSAWSGVPVTRVGQEETERLLNIEQSLRTRVIGQEAAIKTVADTVRVMRMGLGNPNRPAGVFLFLGPTGVGKTELAKALAEFLFGSEKDYIRIDMSEYMEKHAISRLIGSPPGYVGHEEEGQLTQQVRRRPFSVVLLDEIEKAHPDVFDLFLQVFDDGRLTDSKGRTVNFTNTIIICTSNVGTRHDVASDPDDPAVIDHVDEELRKKFRLEFINRFDERVIFRSLDQKALEKIVDKLVGEKARQVRESRGLMLAVSADARALLLKKGYSPAYGARPLKRIVETMLVKPLAHELLSGKYRSGDLITARAEGERLVFVKEDFDWSSSGGGENPSSSGDAPPARPSPQPPPARRPSRSDEGTLDGDTGRLDEAHLAAAGASARGTRGSRDPDRSERKNGRDPERSVTNAPTAPSDLASQLRETEDDDDLKPTLPRRRPDLGPRTPPATRPDPRSDAFSDDDFWDDLNS
jgi:ATP-dependent Clp protease ATP-binding subunit ClpC